jgi:ABC-type lipoprotein export system ATPase subunit
LIRIEGLEFEYGDGDFRLRIPELHVAANDRVAFVGPSGSGKTTLLHLIAGILVPPAGRIETAGTRLEDLADDRRRSFRIRRIGLVFQEFELLEYLNVLDNILLPYRISPALRLDRTVRERARALAFRLGIGDQLARLPDRLSQGERQRVAVCRAVLPEPDIVLADEPTGNLDPRNAERVLDILFGYAESRPATLLTVTHDHGILTRFSRVVDLATFHDPAPGGGATG